jgi:tetratricopeptide (TPR) repeat protein
MTGKILTALTKIEAESHWSRGKLKEAVDIYTKLLADSPHMTLNTRTAIEARIQVLAGELGHPPGREAGRDIERAIEKLQKAVAADSSIADARLKAKLFCQQGLYADALEQLKQLVRHDAADEFCVDATVNCLIKLNSPEQMPVAVDLLLAESFRDAEKAALFKFMLANKMAKKGHWRHADALHGHADRFTSSAL